MLAVRRDADTTLVGTTNDYAPLQVDANGFLKVEIFDGGNSHTVDNAGLTELAAAINSNELDVNIASSNATVTVTATNLDCQSGGADMATAAAQLADGHNVMVDNSTGGSAVNIQDGGNSITVDTAAAFTVQEDGAALTALQLIDNAVHADAAAFTDGSSSGMGCFGVHQSTPDTVANDTFSPILLNSTGGQKVELMASTATTEVVGDVAVSAAAAGNPVLAGVRCTATVEGLAEVSEGDSNYVNADLSGTLITRVACAPAELVSFYVANTDGAEDAVTALDDGGAAIYNFITSVTIHNSNASTNGFVSLLDGSAGSTFWVFPAPATGGTTHNFNPPLRQPTISTALFVDPSASISTIHISISGFQGNG